MQTYGYFLLFISFISLSFMGGCSETGERRETGEESSRSSAAPAVSPPLSGRIVEPSQGDIFTREENISIVVDLDDEAGEVAAVNMTVDGQDAVFSGDVLGTLIWDSSGQPVGSRQIRVIVVFGDETTETYSLRIELKSDIVPVQYGFRIINSYPHDIRAFTQGLVYDDGYFYESTGKYGESTLRKVRAETGEVMRSLNLDRELFGEGLCVFDGKLYQLTWQSGVGFVYDKETFRVLRRIYYQTEGWGLTTDGTSLLKSDGSHNLYVMDPQYFSETARIEVYDNNGRVGNLNELEFIDGLIYANVFDTDHIVIIEPETGRVTGRIDLNGLLDPRHHHPNLDVLHGIAYDRENGRLFVTGKNWPRLFEIEKVRRS